MTWGADRVNFDFEGSLRLARRLWALGDELRVEDERRDSHGETALAEWRGAYATAFAVDRDTERSNRQNMLTLLHTDAREWASLWADAMDEQNRRNRAAEVTKRRESRSGLKKFGDALGVTRDDSDDLPHAAPVPVPVAPSFSPTVTDVVF